MDIIVTTPKSEMANAAKEASNCIAQGGGLYFRRFATIPCDLHPGQKVFYVEDGYIRGYAVVFKILDENGKECSTTGKKYPSGVYIYMKADSWKWIDPIPMKGFQGYRRAFSMQYKVIGDWTTAKPIA